MVLLFVVVIVWCLKEERQAVAINQGDLMSVFETWAFDTVLLVGVDTVRGESRETR